MHLNEGGVRKFVGNLIQFIKYYYRGLCCSKLTDVSKVNYSRKRNGLKLASFNILSPRKYKDELRITLNDNEIDAVGLNETRLDAKIDDREFMIEGYKIFRKDRNRHGDGVAIYVKDCLDVIQVEQQMGNLELLSIEIKPKSQSLFSGLMVPASNRKCGRCYL